LPRLNFISSIAGPLAVALLMEATNLLAADVNHRRA
jgi:hypothetical protein